jgi:hypothetical protein
MDIPVIGQRPKVNDKVCQALSKVLVDAKRGLVSSVAIVAVGEDGRPNVIFGGESDLSPSVNLGLDMLKATMMQQILGAPQMSIVTRGDPQ